MRVDLHIHTSASDGRWSPEQVVDQVRREGIELFAIADHDTIDHVRPTEAHAAGAGLAFLRAVEISTTLHDYLFHILGYDIVPEDAQLLDLLARNRETMEQIDRQSIRKLIAAGYEISMDDYDRYEHDPPRGGWKALSLFIDRGFCTSVADFYGRLFSGDMALVMPPFAPPDEVISTIHRTGGIAICAHPGYSVRGDDLGMLDELIALGLDGLECYSPYHDRALTDRLIAFARARGLLITAGSDCHGGFAARALGQPEAYLRDLELGPLLSRAVR
ncbi:MAG: PHP domain-containing protein [Anaerolineae bacterium]|nr:PHP domain-containing protein [Anaerolineae bacterium]